MAIPYAVSGKEIRPRQDAVASAALAVLNAELVHQLDDAGSFLTGGNSVCSLDVRGTFTGTLSLTGTVDGINYFTIGAVDRATRLYSTAITVAGSYYINVAGLAAVRVVMTAYTSGSATCVLRAGLAKYVDAPLLQPADKTVTVTAATGVSATLTIPAGGVGLFHYFTRIIIQRHTSAIIAAVVTPILVTTTNLPGTRVFSFKGNAAAAGDVEEEILVPTLPLKCSAANTPTTIVMPATTSVIWRATADYYLAT